MRPSKATSAPHRRRHIAARALLTVVAVCCDGVIAVINLWWLAQRHQRMSSHEQGTFSLLGVSAALGVVILALALAATIRSRRTGYGGAVATTGLVLAWLRLLAVIATIIALNMITADDFYLAVLAITDATIAVVITHISRR